MSNYQCEPENIRVNYMSRFTPVNMDTLRLFLFKTCRAERIQLKTNRLFITGSLQAEIQALHTNPSSGAEGSAPDSLLKNNRATETTNQNQHHRPGITVWPGCWRAGGERLPDKVSKCWWRFSDTEHVPKKMDLVSESFHFRPVWSLFQCGSENSRNVEELWESCELEGTAAAQIKPDLVQEVDVTATSAGDHGSTDCLLSAASANKWPKITFYCFSDVRTDQNFRS